MALAADVRSGNVEDGDTETLCCSDGSAVFVEITLLTVGELLGEPGSSLIPKTVAVTVVNAIANAAPMLTTHRLGTR